MFISGSVVVTSGVSGVCAWPASGWPSSPPTVSGAPAADVFTSGCQRKGAGCFAAGVIVVVLAGQGLEVLETAINPSKWVPHIPEVTLVEKPTAPVPLKSGHVAHWSGPRA